MKKKVLVIGASGFVGGHLAKQLLAEGYSLRCLARTPSKVQDLAASGCEVVEGDILNSESLQRAMTGIDAVYVSVQTLVPQHNQGETDFMELELQGLRNIVAICHANQIKRLIFVTFLGVASESKSAWIRGRWEAEQLLLHSGLDVTVLRPGMIVGKGGQGFNMLAANVSRRLAIVMGSGQKRFRSIAIDDLVYYLIGVMDDSRTFGHCYDVGNDDVLRMDEMIDQTADILGKSHPVKLHISWGVPGMAAPLIEWLSKTPKGAVKGMLDSMQTEMIGDPKPIRQVLTKPLLTYRQAAQKALKKV